MGYVLITGGNLKNKGAQSMVYIAVDEVAKRYPDKRIVVLSDADAARSGEELSRYRFLFRDYVCLYGRKYQLVQRRYGRLDRAGDAAEIRKNVDMVIDISGYTFGSNWGIAANLLAAYRAARAKKYGAPIYFMPQSFGPFEWKGIAGRAADSLLRRWLSYAEVLYAREQEGYGLLKERYGLSRVFSSPDLVLQNRGIDPVRVFVSYHEQELPEIAPDSVGILPNIRNDRYGGAERMDGIYRTLIDRLLEKGRRVYLIRHASEDLDCCRRIKAMYREDARVVLIEEDFDCFAYGRLAEKMDYLVASRYHAVVHAYRAGVPCIVFGWAIKYQELLKQFDQQRYAFDVRETPDGEEIRAVVDRMEERYAQEAETICGRLTEVRRGNVFDCIGYGACDAGERHADGGGSADGWRADGAGNAGERHADGAGNAGERHADGAGSAGKGHADGAGGAAGESARTGKTATVARAVQTRQCISCGICAAVCPADCIRYERREGYFVPVIDEERCLHCGRCAQVCYGLYDAGDRTHGARTEESGGADSTGRTGKSGSADSAGRTEESGGADNTGRTGKSGSADNTGRTEESGGADSTGRTEESGSADSTGRTEESGSADCLTARAKDEALLANATSGGVVTAMVRRLLEDGAYDTAFLADGDCDGEQIGVRAFGKGEELSSSQKSRYVPVSQQNAVRFILSHPEARVVYVGCACAVYGLLRALEQAGQDRERLLVIGLFCDRTMTYSIVDYFRARYKRKRPDGPRLERLYFRDKRSGGWPGDMRLEFADGSVRRVSAKERMIVKDFFQARRCLRCPDKLNRHADLAVGDNYTGKNCDGRGAGSVMLYTERGRRAWERCAGEFAAAPSSEEEICRSQHMERKREAGQIAPDSLPEACLRDIRLGERGEWRAIEKRKRAKRLRLYLDAIRERLSL